MKKILSLILIISMVLTSAVYLASCNYKTPSGEPTEAVTETPTEKSTSGVTDAETDGETSGTVESTTDSSSEETNFATEADTTESNVTDVTDENDSEEFVSEPAQTDEETEAPTEPETETETETIPVGPAEPLCETCKFKTVKGIPICSVCGYVAPCLGVHDYTADIEGHWKPACEHCGKAAGNPQNHEYEERVEDEGDLLLYSFKCPICLFVAYEQEVPYHINLFNSAGEISKADFTGTGFEQGFGFEAGVGYSAFSTETGGSFTVNIAKAAEPNAPTGQFLVMKVRLPKTQTSFSANIMSNSAVSAKAMLFSGLSSGWVTIIVDVTKAITVTEKTDPYTEETYNEYQGYAPDAAGDYYLTDFTITANAAAGESFDIAYVLLCDKIDDAENFVKEQGGVTTVYRYLESLDKAETEKSECRDENGNLIEHKYVVNENGTHTLAESCYQCGLKAVENEPHTFIQLELDDGDLAYACSACGYSKFGVGVNINKFIDAAGVDSSAKNYFRNTKNGVLIDEEGGFEYASFSGQGNTAQIIFTRNTADANAGEKAAYFSVGTAKYFVIRMKTNRCTMNYTFTFATYNAEMVDGKHNGVLVGQFPTATTFNVPISFGGDDNWTTYVMDLSKLAPKSWVADENGNHMVYTFYCNIGGADYTSDVNIDFEYMAFVDDWDEINAIVSDETVVNVLAGGGGNLVNTETKACVGEHSGATSQTENGYKVECAVCGVVIKEIVVPDDVNYYSNLDDMNKYMTGSLTKFLYDDEADVLYNRYEGSASSHLNLTGGSGAGTWTQDKYMTGEYIVIKYRMQSTSLTLNIATKDFGQNPNYNDATRPYYSSIGSRKCVGGLSYWSVALIKIPDKIGEQDVRFTKGEEQEIGIMVSTSNSPYIFDVAYIAIVDSIDEAKLLLEEGEVLEDLGESWNGEITEIMPEEPESDEPEEGKVYEVTEFGPDKLVTPPENPTGSFDFTVMEEDGVSFVRIDNMTVNGDGWAAINYLNGSNTAKGRYFAMKFRIGDNGLSQTYLKIYTGTTGSLQGEGQGVSVKVSEDGEWCVIVVDLLNCIGDKGSYMVKDAGGGYTLRYFAIRPFSNNQSGSEKVADESADPDAKYMYKYTYPDPNDSTKTRSKWSAVKLTDEEATAKGWTYEGTYKMSVSPDAYMDIAYIKFFEHKSQIKDVVDTDTYDWSVDKSTNTTLRTEDNSCVVCSISEVKDGNTYKYVCTSCGKEHKTVTVAESVVKYYSANELATGAKQYYGPVGTTYGFATEDGVYYTETVALKQIIWQRANADMDGKNTSRADQEFTESVGNAKYLVIKARTSGEDGYLSIQLSTTARNATLKVAETNMPGYYKGHTTERDELDENVKGVLAGGTYRSDTGYKSAYVISAGTGTGEWMTYVIDLEAIYGEYYAKAEGEDFYCVDTLFMNFGGNVDISYMAFVEGDWTNVDEIVDETEVANITATTGEFEMVNVADGTPAAKAE